MRTMTAKYPGTCPECGERITPGDRIVYFGRGHVEHEHCAQEHEELTGEWEEESPDRPSAATLANDRRLARQGLTVVRLSSGHTFTQNSRGRCEDAPCCGCCT